MADRRKRPTPKKKDRPLDLVRWLRTPILAATALDATDNFDMHLFQTRYGFWEIRADFTEWTGNQRRARRVYFEANDLHAFIAMRILRVARAPEKKGKKSK